MSRPCPCRHDPNPHPCDACERRAEVIRDGDDWTPADRARGADEQADREERQRDEWFGGWAS